MMPMHKLEDFCGGECWGIREQFEDAHDLFPSDDERWDFRLCLAENGQAKLVPGASMHGKGWRPFELEQLNQGQNLRLRSTTPQTVGNVTVVVTLTLKHNKPDGFFRKIVFEYDNDGAHGGIAHGEN